MKIYIICFVPAQIPKLGKVFVPEIRAKMFSASHIAGFFNQPYLWNKSMKYPDFFHIDTNSLKSLSKKLWVGMVRNGCGWSGHRTLKLTVSQECTGEVNRIF